MPPPPLLPSCKGGAPLLLSEGRRGLREAVAPRTDLGGRQRAASRERGNCLCPGLYAGRGVANRSGRREPCAARCVGCAMLVWAVGGCVTLVVCGGYMSCRLSCVQCSLCAHTWTVHMRYVHIMTPAVPVRHGSGPSWFRLGHRCLAGSSRCRAVCAHAAVFASLVMDRV
jgi:hypothetical protein